MNYTGKVYYIYNPKQASFYITNGATCLNTGINYKTRKTFWVFDSDDTEEVYSKWCSRKH